MFELIREDYNRHGRSLLNPAFGVLLTYRYGVWSRNTINVQPFRWLASKFYGFLAFMVFAISGDRLHREVTIGKGFHIVHAGNIGIHPKVIIGDNCGIMQDVVIGTVPNRKGAVPEIGNYVFIGRGATILGKIKIGDHARIAANSLVITDVPAYSTAIGVPAKIIRHPERPINERDRDDSKN